MERKNIFSIFQRRKSQKREGLIRNNVLSRLMSPQNKTRKSLPHLRKSQNICPHQLPAKKSPKKQP
nr:putative coat protein [Eel virus European X]